MLGTTAVNKLPVLHLAELAFRPKSTGRVGLDTTVRRERQRRCSAVKARTWQRLVLPNAILARLDISVHRKRSIQVLAMLGGTAH
jgi:hypothetical protein